MGNASERTTHEITADLIGRAEETVGAAFQSELSEHLILAREVINVAGELIERIQDAPGEARAIHVGAILLARLITDLRACCLLVGHGYPGQALSLTAGMLEIAHTSMHIGADEEMAQHWLSHADPKTAAPWRLKAAIKGVATAMSAGDAADREYDLIYRDASMTKHGNPMAMGPLQIAVEGDSTFILVGPIATTPARRAAHVAMLNAIRYAKLSALKFCRDHVQASQVRDGIFDQFQKMSGRHRVLIERAMAEFGAIDDNDEEVNNG
jgi:hypothetical protein